MLDDPDVHCFLFIYKTQGLSAKAILTNYRVLSKQLILIPDTPAFLKSQRIRPEYFVVPWLLINHIQSEVTRDLVMIDIQTKDGRALRFSFSSLTNSHIDIYSVILSQVQPSRLVDRFAFAYSFPEASFGWGFYNVEREFERLGVIDESGTVMPM